MAAIVQVSESNGAVETVTDGITNINFGSADLPNLVPASHKLVLPLVSQTAYSYMKWLRVHLVSLGGSTQIDTLKIWKSSGAYVTSEVIGSNITTQSPAPNWTITVYGHAINSGAAV